MGGFLIKARTTGVSKDADGYTILIAPTNAAGSYAYGIGINDSILVTHQKLASHPSYWVQVQRLSTNCWPAQASFTQTATVWHVVTPVEFVVDCIASNRMFSYRRLTPHFASTIAFHGGLTERYALSDDGRFRLQVTSGRLGDFEYLGNYTRLPANELSFAFEAGERWEATVTQRGDSLFVSYSDQMLQSGFESGVFVRRLFR